MADKTYLLDKDSGGVIPVSQVENDGGTDSVTVKGNSTSGAMYVEEKDSAGNSMNDGAGNKNVVLKDSIPAGSNIIGQVQLTDGTDGLAIDSNGNINIVPVDSSGTSLVDANGNLKVSVNGTIVDFDTQEVSFSTTVAAGDNVTEALTVPAGEIWEIKECAYRIDKVPSATTGTHKVIVYIGSKPIATAQINFDKNLRYGQGIFGDTAEGINPTIATTVPADAATISKLFENKVLDPSNVLKFRYFNDSDADQTNTRTIELNIIRREKKV